MDEKITFRAEVEFCGTPDDLGNVIAALRKLPLEIFIEKWPRPPWPPGPIGLAPFPMMNKLAPEFVNKITKNASTIPVKLMEGINGGIRDPHLHLKDKIALLDRETFAQVIGNVAEQMAREIALGGDYARGIGVIRELSEMEDVL